MIQAVNEVRRNEMGYLRAAKWARKECGEVASDIFCVLYAQICKT